MSKRYADIAHGYARDVVSGKVIACEHVKRACERQLADLDRDWDYFFVPELADRVCKFVELMPHIKGEWAGKKITLEPWQVFILSVIFGWVDEHGNRRFKTAYVEVPRKNAKSTLSSGVALYCLAADAEAGAEVYSAATTRDQARIVWADAKRMAERSPGLQARFGVKTSAHAVFVEDTASTFKALSRDQGGNLDGLNVHCAIIDELHAHKTREVFDVIETATGARAQPLLWLITTAGFNRSGICYEQRSYTAKVLNGAEKDEEYFGIIYTLDEDDDWTDPNCWAKANPNWGVSVKPADIARKARKAMAMSAAQNNFLTKHLNVWVNADTAWMDMRAWDRCESTRTLDEFEGQTCWIGLDLASKTDIASMAILFKRDGKLYGFLRNYLNEAAVEDGRNSQYSGWERDGRLVVTPGNVTDYGYIERDLMEFASRFRIECVAYDPWQAEYLSQRLAEEGLEMLEYRQTVQNMSSAMKEFEASVLSEQFQHDGDPVFTWMVSNVVAHVDAKENIYPRKEMPENKIDGVVAMLMAYGRALLEEDTTSVYETRGIRFL
ncbi:terminase large subunit [Microbulbifer sp. HZ11]|uniref:terminase large subunit n=1 Tax=Microbulbifer sp. HZ11 TaxID=1453501 RepID=UPI0005BB814F|nr:terminase TerL endonuclease subunit [Microbulbifer sp. HZ11]